LTTAERLLSEVYSIGVWVKADDCSDNRRKRTGIREADWAVSAAYRALKAIDLEAADVQAAVSVLADDAHAVVRLLEPLPDTIPDTMGDNLSLDATINTLGERVAGLRERVKVLAVDYANHVKKAD
jgi:hypothetical protein